MIVIYGLSSSSDVEDIRYIGKSSNIENRLKRHLSKYCLKDDSYKNNWIKSELISNNTIIITTIEEVTESNWQDREIFWISEYKKLGYNLTNLTAGGEGFNLTNDIKTKRNKTILDKSLNKFEVEIDKFNIKKVDEHWVGNRVCYFCNKLIIHKGKKISLLINLLNKSINRKCLSCKNKGLKHTQEAKDKISKSKEVISIETREKLSTIHKGRTTSEKTKEKIRNANLGKKASIETREKISKIHSKPLTCIETGEIFSSIKEASEKLNISYNILSVTLRSGFKKVGNYTFEFNEK